MSFFLGSVPNDNRMKMIAIDKILPNPCQPRRHFDENAIRTLADSIAQYGVIQPISVRAGKYGGKYELVAGERRLRAAKLSGLQEVPCLVIHIDEKKSAEIAMIENTLRCNLDIFEEAEAIEKLLHSGGCTQATLAARLCMSQSALANKLRILRFDPLQRELICRYHLTERHARAILRLPPDKRTEMILTVGKDNLSVSATELKIDEILCEKIITEELSVKKAPRRKPEAEKTKEEPLSAEPSGTPIRTFVMKDLTLFYNSLERSVALLNHAGFAADMKRQEENGEVRVSIVVKDARSE